VPTQEDAGSDSNLRGHVRQGARRTPSGGAPTLETQAELGTCASHDIARASRYAHCMARGRPPRRMTLAARLWWVALGLAIVIVAELALR
jgi:hypothetical protein